MAILASALLSSCRTFQHLWKQVGNNIARYGSFPRLIGECGGKNYHFVHPTADGATVAAGTVRSAFEFGGQKCSACSRMYVPRSRWDEVSDVMSCDASYNGVTNGERLQPDAVCHRTDIVFFQSPRK